uniref:histidine kinase n=1 Tax=candidate division WOR-3 bacterium TaxID=2052148 RepID=A0A7V1EIC0_UNCW3
MQDLSLHILDIVENSIDAGATKIEIMIDEDIEHNQLKIKIKDNGKGMDKETLKKVLDPFYTTKTVRRVGLGLSLFAQTVKEAEGEIEIKSELKKGTAVSANLKYNHIDRKPMGNIIETIMALLATKAQGIDFIYVHRKNKNEFVLNTKEIKTKLDGVMINEPEVLKFLRIQIKNGLKEIGVAV